MPAMSARVSLLAVAVWTLTITTSPTTADLASAKLDVVLDLVQRLDSRLNNQDLQYSLESLVHQLQSLESGVSAELTELKADMARAAEQRDAATRAHVTDAAAVLAAGHQDVQQACSAESNGQTSATAAVMAALTDLADNQQQETNVTRAVCEKSIADMAALLTQLLRSDGQRRLQTLEQHTELTEQLQLLSGRLQEVERQLHAATEQLQRQQQQLAAHMTTTTPAPTTAPPPTVDPYRKLLWELHSGIRNKIDAQSEMED